MPDLKLLISTVWTDAATDRLRRDPQRSADTQQRRQQARNGRHRRQGT
jgi:hypothetical protein